MNKNGRNNWISPNGYGVNALKANTSAALPSYSGRLDEIEIGFNVEGLTVSYCVWKQ